MKGQRHHTKPGDQYNRLLTAFGLEQDADNSRTYLTRLSELLDVGMSQLSDSIRRRLCRRTCFTGSQGQSHQPGLYHKGGPPQVSE